jgi:asparagine synthase (glutamine-hydrolysing)
VIRTSGLPGGILNSLWGIDMFAAATAAGHNVMLTGEMGNITISYHGWGLFTEFLLTGRWLRLLVEITFSGYRWQRHVRQQLIAPLIPAPLLRSYKQWRRGGSPLWHFSVIHPEFAAQSGVIDRTNNVQFDIRDWKLGRIYEIRDHCDIADWFGKVRAAFGLDLRTPAADRRVVEFCIGIPQDQYLRKGRDRWLIRRAMEGRLPDGVSNQKKSGAQAADWYPRLTRARDQIADEVKRLRQNPEVASMIDMQRLTAILDNWPNRQPPEYTPEEQQLLEIPDALGMAYFIDSVAGTNQLCCNSANLKAANVLTSTAGCVEGGR